ncbi:MULTISPECIES: hypothetical protein [unclassified Nocardia]|uniref:hypothetical protein n=1 Tax=unclassified Nocardia TaxID=2637762 RepID=UPI0012DE5ED8|nr:MULTISPECIES: hypothetical protein [unclassified Nocardia]MCX4097664.1 hypothetical protein [Nocardia sp. alder85J]
MSVLCGRLNDECRETNLPGGTMLGKPLLFLSGYAPLFALLAIRFQPLTLLAGCAILALLGATSLILLLVLDARATPGIHRLQQVKDAGTEAGAYLGAYLLPFVTVTTPNLRDILAYCAFIVVSAAIYLHSSLVQINPMLYILGYRVLQITDSNGLEAYLITRRKIEIGQSVAATRFRDGVLVDRTGRKGHTGIDNA